MNATPDRWAALGKSVQVRHVDHTDEVIAQHIHGVQMQAYAQEAALLGATDFPPLRRTVGDLRSSGEEFFGAYYGKQLVGSISVESGQGQVGKTICSLTVAPKFQRSGVAKQLVGAVLQLYGFCGVTVQTGAKNLPALNLYAQFGFSERERSLVGHEPLEIVVLCRPALLASSLAARSVRIGGTGKAELLTELQEAGVAVNEAGRSLFADERFTTSATTSVIQTVELSVGGLGFPNGATFEQIVQRAIDLGLSLCPLELGPHLRLQFLDQAEGAAGQPVTQHCAPPGSITVASRPISDDHDTPKGFYLRRINGVLWLRGYRSGAEHIWSPKDAFIFCK